MQMTQDLLTELPAHPFWDYSLLLYKQNDVKQACLNLQDNYQLNVNIILFICWLAHTGRGRLDLRELQRLTVESYAWQQKITAKLRKIRRYLAGTTNPPWAKALAKIVLEEELIAEHIEQLLLTDIISHKMIKKVTMLQQAQEAVASLYSYCQLCRVPASKKLAKLMQTMVAAAFPQLTPEQLDKLCTPFAVTRT